MALAAYWTRMSLRHRWRGLLGIIVLLGLIGGLSLLTLAGARRTLSAYPRFLRSTNPSTMAVIAGGLQDPEAATVLDRTPKLPQVTEAHAYVSFNAAFMVGNKPDLTRDFEALGSMDGRYYVQDRFTPTQGRRPERARADEIALNEDIARRYSLHLGDRVDIGVFSDEQVQDPAFFDHPTPPQVRVTSTVVGIGLFIEEVVQDDTDRGPLILFTPAFVEKVKAWETYAWEGLVLRRGDADVAAVKREFQAMTGPGYPQFFRVTSIDTFHAQQATRPVAIALGVFGAIAGLAVLLLVGQSLGRHFQAEAYQRTVARALGASPRASALASSIAPAMAVLAGVAVAVAVAVAASPTMPIGTMRRVEVHRGVDLDLTVLGLGSLVLIVTAFAVTALLAQREAPERVLRRSLRRTRRGPGLTARATRLPLALTTGLRLAFERGEGASAVPVRSILSGAIVAVASLVAAVTFGAGLHHLVDHPRLFGWDWDVALVDQQGYGNTKPGPTNEILSHDPGVDAWGGAFLGSDQIDGQNLPVLGMDVGSRITPPLRAGRMIESDSEIVLGTATLADLKKNIGDSVRAGDGRSLRIVGTATLPTVGVVHGDHTSLGIGGLIETKRVPGYDRNITDTGEYGPNVIFVRFRAGANRATVTKRLAKAADRIGDFPGAVDVTAVQRPAEIVNANDIGNSPTLLGIAVALSAMSALILALTAAVRGRRRDLALLKALGFTRRQLSATVACQTTATVLTGLLVGVPVGAAFGRLLWSMFAHQLNVLAEPTTPVVLIGLVIVASVALANVLSVIPAHFARTVPASVVLRSE